MTRNRLGLVLLVLATAALPFPAPCVAATQITMLDRGIVVDDDHATTSALGHFSSQLSNSNELGSAHAWMTSDIDTTRILVSGEVSEFATELDLSFDPRAQLYLVAEFTVSDAHEFDYMAFGGGSSDSEHWQSYVTLLGPNIEWRDRWDSVGASSGQVARQGVFYPGEYELTIRAFPTVYGGLDLGWATAGVEFDLSINPEIYLPEPTALLPWLFLVSLAMFRHRSSSRIGDP